MFTVLLHSPMELFAVQLDHHKSQDVRSGSLGIRVITDGMKAMAVMLGPYPHTPSHSCSQNILILVLKKKHTHIHTQSKMQMRRAILSYKLTLIHNFPCTLHYYTVLVSLLPPLSLIHRIMSLFNTFPKKALGAYLIK